MIFFIYKESKSKKIFLGWGGGVGGARVSEILLQRIQMYKIFFVCVCVGGGGMGGGGGLE